VIRGTRWPSWLAANWRNLPGSVDIAADHPRRDGGALGPPVGKHGIIEAFVIED
jgi:hypothetical protein